MLHWLRQLSRYVSRSPKKTVNKNRARPVLEALEDRSVPAAIQPIQCGTLTLQPLVVNDAMLANIADRICARLPTVTFNLDPASDTGTVGDLRTTRSVVNLTGQASSRALVRLVGTNIATRADSRGRFTLRNVTLNPDRNALTVQATSRGGITATATQIVTLNVAPTLRTRINDVGVLQGAPDSTIDLAAVFADANAAHTLVRFSTSSGDVDAELFDDRTPLSVANFLNYVNSGRYQNTIFHRSVSNFVVQGGGFRFDATSHTLPAVQTDPPVRNEPGISNLRGTIAIAKLGGDPNSGTSQFFFNLANNAANLDNQNGGFTVFGQVTGNGMSVVDRIAAIPTQNRGGAFTEIPLVNFPSSRRFPNDLQSSNLALLNNVTVRALGERLTFSATSSNANLVTAAIEQNTLRLHFVPGQTGSATVTVRATDREGAFVETTFTVTVS
jgi:cyclophilin family peptidyl-prolyl cis-trans isomerase